MPLEWMRRANRSKANTTTGDLYANKFEERQAERRRYRNLLIEKMPSKDMGLRRNVKDTFTPKKD